MMVWLAGLAHVVVQEGEKGLGVGHLQNHVGFREGLRAEEATGMKRVDVVEKLALAHRHAIARHRVARDHLRRQLSEHRRQQLGLHHAHRHVLLGRVLRRPEDVRKVLVTHREPAELPLARHDVVGLLRTRLHRWIRLHAGGDDARAGGRDVVRRRGLEERQLGRLCSQRWLATRENLPQTGIARTL